MIAFQQESLIAIGLSLCIKEGVIGFANAKLFAVTDNPQAGAIYSLFHAAILSTIAIPHVHFLREEIRNGTQLNLNELMEKQPIVAAAFLLYCSAILAIGILGGRYLANRYDLKYNQGRTTLSYRQVAVLEIIRGVEISTLGI